MSINPTQLGLLPAPVRTSAQKAANMTEILSQSAKNSSSSVLTSAEKAKNMTEIMSQSAKNSSTIAEEAGMFSKIKTGVSKFIPDSVKNASTNLVKWGNAPIAESPVYQKIAGAAGNGLTNIAEKAGAESMIGKAAIGTKGFLGKMTGVAEGGGLFSKGNAAFAAAFEAPDIIEGFKEGRGLAQTAQSGTKVGAGIAGGLAATAGAVTLGLISGPVGWAALAVGVVGSAVGYMLGDKATSFLGHNKKGLFDSEPAVQNQQIAQQINPNQQGFLSQTTMGQPNYMMPYGLSDQIVPLPPLVA